MHDGIATTALAQGHAAYELSEPKLWPPDRLALFQLPRLTEAERHSFEWARDYELLPEAGSRAMVRMAEVPSDVVDGWVVVQPGRYQYLASSADGVVVRIVLSEHLGCEAAWGRD